jgi:hypothetical protein
MKKAIGSYIFMLGRKRLQFLSFIWKIVLGLRSWGVYNPTTAARIRDSFVLCI